MKLGRMTGMVLIAMLVAWGLACGGGNAPAPPATPATPATAPATPAPAAGGPATITLTWNADCDLDLYIDGSPAYGMDGGTEDSTGGAGSMESITLASGRHDVGAFNWTFDLDGDAVITVTREGSEPFVIQGTPRGEMEGDMWNAFSIDIATGEITEIGTYE